MKTLTLLVVAVMVSMSAACSRQAPVSTPVHADVCALGTSCG